MRNCSVLRKGSIITCFSFICYSTIIFGITFEEHKLELNKCNSNIVRTICKINEIAKPGRAIGEYQELGFELINDCKDLEANEILPYFMDARNTEPVQYILFDIYANKLRINNNKVDRSILIATLKEDNDRNQLKSYLVSYLDKKDLLFIKELTSAKNTDVAFQALKQLRVVDEKEGYLISKKIFANREHENERMIECSMWNIADYFKKMNNNDDKKEFVKEVIEILNSPKYSNLIYSCSMALDNVRSSEAITELIFNKKIESNKKFCAIERNWKVLDEMIKNSPNDKNLNTVLAAMEINPLQDLLGTLEKSRNIAKTDANRQRLEKVMGKIRKENRPAFCYE